MRRLLPLIVIALLVAAAPASAKRQHKPLLKVLGFSINSVFVPKGSVIEAEESTNTCYRIGGPTGAPDQLTAAVFVKAVKVPKSAVTHFEFDTPFNTAPGLTPEDAIFDGKFNAGLFPSKPTNAGGAFGGPTGGGAHYAYRMLPTPGSTSGYFTGDFKMKVTAVVNGKTLSARGKVTLQCA